MEYVTLGKIVNTFGIKGDIKVVSTTDFATSRYKKGSRIYFYNPELETRIEMEVASHRLDGTCDIVHFLGIDDINEAKKYMNQLVQIPVATLPRLNEDTFYHYQLLQSHVITLKGEIIGIVSAIEEYSTTSTLRIKREKKKDVLIPFLQQFVKEVKINEKIIVIDPIEGMIE